MGITKTKEALRIEVSGVSRTYYLQVWNGALNQAGVESSSAIRRVENVYNPPAICASSSSSPKANTVSQEANGDKGSPTKVLSSSSNPSKEAEQSKATKKEKDITTRAVLEAAKPPNTPRDPSKGK